MSHTPICLAALPVNLLSVDFNFDMKSELRIKEKLVKEKTRRDL